MPGSLGAGTAVPDDAAAQPPTVTFALDFPQSNPSRYAITVDASGRASYESTGRLVQGSEPEDYRQQFEISARNRDRIFDLAKQAKYFAGSIDSGNRKIAFTGSKTLTYQDRQGAHSGTFNYSSLEAVQRLTELFQSVGATLEFGRRLAYFHHYQKLALDEELKRMDDAARSDQLGEIQAVAAVLREIAEDASVINVVRARAQELLRRGDVTDSQRAR